MYQLLWLYEFGNRAREFEIAVKWNEERKNRTCAIRSGHRRVKPLFKGCYLRLSGSEQAASSRDPDPSSTLV